MALALVALAERPMAVVLDALATAWAPIAMLVMPEALAAGP